MGSRCLRPFIKTSLPVPSSQEAWPSSAAHSACQEQPRVSAGQEPALKGCLSPAPKQCSDSGGLCPARPRLRAPQVTGQPPCPQQPHFTVRTGGRHGHLGPGPVLSLPRLLCGPWPEPTLQASDPQGHICSCRPCPGAEPPMPCIPSQCQARTTILCPHQGCLGAGSLGQTCRGHGWTQPDRASAPPPRPWNAQPLGRTHSTGQLTAGRPGSTRNTAQGDPRPFCPPPAEPTPSPGQTAIQAAPPGAPALQPAPSSRATASTEDSAAPGSQRVQPTVEPGELRLPRILHQRTRPPRL